MKLFKSQWYKSTTPCLIGGAIEQVKHRITRERCAFGKRGEMYIDGKGTFAIIYRGHGILLRKLFDLIERSSEFNGQKSGEVLIRGIPDTLAKQVGAIIGIPKNLGRQLRFIE